MKKQHIIFVMSLLSAIAFTTQQAHFVDINTKNIRLIKQKRKQFCYISFVEIDGGVYLVKQKRSQGQLLAAVHDVLAAHIAQSLDSAIAHKVMMIPAFKKFPGKRYDDWPATLHTLATGSTIKEKRSPYKKMNIKQACQGFRREMIGWMAQHKQLIKILALDIFLCNHDRHQGNLFYDPKTKTFCAIDMDLLFKHNLVMFAHQNLRRMEEYDLYPLTTKEALALVELRNILEFLVNRHRPEETLALFDCLVKEAGLEEDSVLCTPRVKSDIDISRGTIRSSYRDAQTLLIVLSDIIKKAIELDPVLKNFKVIEEFEKKMIRK